MFVLFQFSINKRIIKYENIFNRRIFYDESFEDYPNKNKQNGCSGMLESIELNKNFQNGLIQQLEWINTLE